MAEAQKLAVRPREVLGKKVGRLRREGTLPGVIFGGHADSVPVQTDARAFQLGYRSWGNTTLLSLEGLDGGGVPALIHGVSREPRTGALLHVNFARVSLTVKTHADVPLRFVGDAGAVRTLGAVLLPAKGSVRVEAFPQDIPHEIRVDLSPLEELDDAIYIRDLIVDTTTVRLLDDGDELVVKTVPVRIEEEPVPAAAAAVVEGVVPVEGAVPAEGTVPAEGAPAAAATAAKGAAAAGPAKGAAPAAPKAAAAPTKKDAKAERS